MKSGEGKDKQYVDERKLLSLHRYYIWANGLRTHFDDCLGKRSRGAEMSVEEFMYMSLWYAHLYVVCEGWNRLKLSDVVVNELLQSKNLAMLKRYRHAVCHYQEEYYHDKFTDLITEGEAVVRWVRTLNQEMGRYFLQWASRENIVPQQ